MADKKLFWQSNILKPIASVKLNNQSEACFTFIIIQCGKASERLGWYGVFSACALWCIADIWNVNPSAEQTVSYEGLTLEMSAIDQTTRAKNIPY